MRDSFQKFVSASEHELAGLRQMMHDQIF